MSYPTYWYIPKVLEWIRGWTMTLSILGTCRRVLRGKAPPSFQTPERGSKLDPFKD